MFRILSRRTRPDLTHPFNNASATRSLRPIDRSEGEISRLTFTISDENRRLLRLMTDFGSLDGTSATSSAIVNKCLRDYFSRVLTEYRKTAEPGDKLLQLMEEMADSAEESSDV